MKTDKLSTLINLLKDMQSAVLAYSGGVDSSFLLKVLQLSGTRTLAITAVSELRPEWSLHNARKTADEIGIKHMVIRTEELLIEKFVSNPPERCFFCKDELFKKLTDIASNKGYKYVLDGSNIDDLRDYRPGAKAALKHSVRSPLTEAGFSKEDIRRSSRNLGLATWNDPASPCLATRIPYGESITAEKLKRIEKAEEYLRSLGFREIRVRDHSGIARIEVSEIEIDSLLDPERRKLVSEELRSLGYTFVSLDLSGLQSGNMNRMLHRDYD